jgi:hypothetical protein
MKRFITDNTGKQIEVVNIEAGIKQAKMFSGYEHKDHPNTIYCNDIHSKLITLKGEIDKEPPIEVIADPITDTIPTWVKAIREHRINNYPEFYLNPKEKSFVKNGNSTTKIDTRLFGTWACVKADQNIRKLDNMEVGETWERFGSPNITRIF